MSVAGVVGVGVIRSRNRMAPGGFCLRERATAGPD
jgi:hypothetical protein